MERGEPVGTVARGWIEFSTGGNSWKPVVRIDELANSESQQDSQYNLFGLLFGVRNYAGFAPVAGVRGLPDNCSGLTREIFEVGKARFHSPSWISLGELKGIKFSGLKKFEDPFPHFYRVEDGIEVSVRAPGFSAEDLKRLAAEKSIKKGPLVAKLEPVRRKDILSRGWLVLVAFMEALSSSLAGGSEENVRVVVWFSDRANPNESGVAPKIGGGNRHNAYASRQP
ncbi:MAG: hypothetical protein V1820_05105 [archaeon]